MSRPPLRKPAAPARSAKPAAFRCPACEASLRVRPGAAGAAFDCPECGAGLLLSTDEEGAVSARTLGGSRPAKRAPLWPFAVGAVGIGCTIAAVWVAVGPGAEPEPEVIAEAAVPPPPPVPAELAAGEVEEERVVPHAKPQADVRAESDPPPVGPPEPVVPEVAPEPIRPPLTAPRPTGDLAAKRLERRLDATLGGYSLPRPAPLGAAVADLEDLLRVRITVTAKQTEPVAVDLPGPVTVRAVLDALAGAAGLRVVIDGTEVRLEP